MISRILGREEVKREKKVVRNERKRGNTNIDIVGMKKICVAKTSSSEH